LNNTKFERNPSDLIGRENVLEERGKIRREFRIK
jgi:hypothetical protein